MSRALLVVTGKKKHCTTHVLRTNYVRPYAQYVQVLKVAFSLKLLKLLKNPLFAFNFELFVPEKVKVVNLTVTLNFFLLKGSGEVGVRFVQSSTLVHTLVGFFPEVCF